MKNAATSIIIAALILLCLWQFFDGRSTKNELEEKYHVSRALWMQEAVKYNRQGAKQDSVIARREHERDSVREASAVTQGALKAQIRALRGRYRPDTLRLTTVDTLVITQDSLIENLEAEKAATKIKTDALVSDLKTRAKLSDEEANKWIGRWQESEALRQEDQKKIRRQRRVERVIEGAIIVVVILVAI